MINGLYEVKFNVTLTDVQSKEEAYEAVKAMLKEMLEDDEMPEVEFELLEMTPEEVEDEYKDEPETDVLNEMRF